MGTVKRMEKWDNVKFLLILCVVMGHFIKDFRGTSGTAQSLYLFIYTFHMPAFVFVSGLFAKKTIQNKRYDKIFGYLMMYFAIKVILFIERFIIKGSSSINLFHESGVAWYGIAIFAFCLLTVFFQRFNKKYVLIAAIVLGLVAGYDSNISDFLTLDRITMFYPFFLFGFYMDPAKITEVTSKKIIKVIAAAFLVIIAALIIKNYESLDWILQVVKGKFQYEDMKFAQHWGWIFRGVYYIFAMMMTFAVIAIMPSGHTFFSKAGSRTLSIYVFHYALMEILFNGFQVDEKLKALWPPHYVYLVFILVVVVTFILSIKPLDVFTKKLMFPKLKEIPESAEK